MSHTEFATATAVREQPARAVARAGPDVALFQCLIVSADAARQTMFVEAAAASDWEPIVCDSVAKALDTLSVAYVQLALVDIEGHQRQQFGRLLEPLTASTDLLVVVCGNEGASREEIELRQMGVWLYLPGVKPASDLELVCREARRISERRVNSTRAFRPAETNEPDEALATSRQTDHR